MAAARRAGWSSSGRKFLPSKGAAPISGKRPALAIPAVISRACCRPLRITFPEVAAAMASNAAPAFAPLDLDVLGRRELKETAHRLFNEGDRRGVDRKM